jgi:hypothetical protein
MAILLNCRVKPEKIWMNHHVDKEGDISVFIVVAILDLHSVGVERCEKIIFRRIEDAFRR